MSLDLLREARRARGLGDYARPEPKPVQPARPEPVEWWTCARCEEEYPRDQFTAAGTAYPGQRICNGCFEEEWPARRVKCSRCDKPMRTRGKCEPMCRPCRKATKPLIPVCPECMEESKVMIKGMCKKCHLRDWRGRHGVNGKQRIGAWTQARAA